MKLTRSDNELKNTRFVNMRIIRKIEFTLCLSLGFLMGVLMAISV